jgi:hypothetical protein
MASNRRYGRTWGEAAARSRDLSLGAKLVATAAFGRYGKGQEPIVFCPVQKIMELCGMSDTSARDYVRELRTKGWLETATRAHRYSSPRYRRVIPESAVAAETDSPESGTARVSETGHPQGVGIPAVRVSGSGRSGCRDQDTKYLGSEGEVNGSGRPEAPVPTRTKANGRETVWPVRQPGESDARYLTRIGGTEWARIHERELAAFAAAVEAATPQLEKNDQEDEDDEGAEVVPLSARERAKRKQGRYRRAAGADPWADLR